MKRFSLLIALWLCLLLPPAACADAYVLHEPSGEQLRAEEAIPLACAFVQELTGVELTGLYSVVDGMKVEGRPEMYFGPGRQWGAETDEDCWVLILRNGTPIDQPMVVLHGSTGRVLYWQYSDTRTNCTYLHMLPPEGWLDAQAAAVLAQERYAVLEAGTLPEPDRTDLCLGASENWSLQPPNRESAPVWNLNLQSADGAARYSYWLAVAADDGSILSEELYRIREDGTVTELVNSRTSSR